MSEQEFLLGNSYEGKLENSSIKRKLKLNGRVSEQNESLSESSDSDDSNYSNGYYKKKKLTDKFYESINIEHDVELLDASDPLDKIMFSLLRNNEKFTRFFNRDEAQSNLISNEIIDEKIEENQNYNGFLAENIKHAASTRIISKNIEYDYDKLLE